VIVQVHQNVAPKAKSAIYDCCAIICLCVKFTFMLTINSISNTAVFYEHSNVKAAASMEDCTEVVIVH